MNSLAKEMIALRQRLEMVKDCTSKPWLRGLISRSNFCIAASLKALTAAHKRLGELNGMGPAQKRDVAKKRKKR